MTRNNCKILGIIGGIGSGKSSISHIIMEEYNAYCIDADKIGHKQLKKGSKAFREITNTFGSITDNEGNIDRRQLSDIVFKDEEKLMLLNSIVHPIMKAEIKKEIDSIVKSGQYDLILLEAALLIVAKWIDLVDIVLYVYCDQEVRIERLESKRKISRDKALSVIDKQMSENELKRYGDYLIDNSFDMEITKKNVRETIRRIEGKE